MRGHDGKSRHPRLFRHGIRHTERHRTMHHRHGLAQNRERCRRQAFQQTLKKPARKLPRRRFTIFDVTGAALWIASVTLLGYAIGNLPWVKGHLQWIFLSMIVIPGVLALIGILRKKKTEPVH